MTDTLFDKGTELQGNAENAALAFRRARAQYHQAFSKYFQEEVETLGAERFNDLVLELRSDLARYRRRGVKAGIVEFFRRAATSEGDYTIEEAIRFARTWDDLKGKLYEPLFNIVENKSDDGYSDLLDALPLVGSEEIEAFVRGDYGNMRTFTKAVKEALGDDEKLHQIVLNGENYFEMTLEDTARKWYALEAVNAYLDEHPEEGDDFNEYR